MIKSKPILLSGLCACLGMAGPLWAQSGVRTYQDLIGVVPGSMGFDTHVNVVTGNLIHLRPELYIPGRGLPLSLVFAYNSSSSENGPYGYGWQMNYGLRYRVDPQNGNVSIVRADGRGGDFNLCMTRMGQLPASLIRWAMWSSPLGIWIGV